MGHITGKHVYGNLYDLEEKRAYHDGDFLLEVTVNAARAARATVIDAMKWEIPGEKGGISVIVLVDESHLAIHTWKEYRYATVDIYTCGDHTDPWAAWNLILSHLKPRRYTVNYADRSQIEAP